MTRRVDELFGARLEGRSRGRWVVALLVLAVPLSLAGLLSCTAVPASLLALWAFHLASSDIERVGRGELAPARLPLLAQSRRIALVAMAVCAVGFLLQLYLFSTSGMEHMLRPLL